MYVHIYIYIYIYISLEYIECLNEDTKKKNNRSCTLFSGDDQIITGANCLI